MKQNVLVLNEYVNKAGIITSALMTYFYFNLIMFLEIRNKQIIFALL